MTKTEHDHWEGALQYTLVALYTPRFVEKKQGVAQRSPRTCVSSSEKHQNLSAGLGQMEASIQTATNS